jgi:hypothetical protein
MGERAFGRVVRRALGRRRAARRPRPWVRVEANPSAPEPLESFRLFAVVGAWAEADVIGATVANAFAQGCERVYLVDNDSPDDTVAEALRAGAILAESFRTDAYDEHVRLALMNAVVTRVSVGEPDAHIWWLFLDADEFHHGSRGRTVREHLAGLDRRFRVVGTRFFNHFPHTKPEYVPGRHPLDFQPLCEEMPLRLCRLGHRKHPLLRWDRGRPRVYAGVGFHRAVCEERPLLEPDDPVFCHHFPFREEEVSRRRLELLCGPSADGAARARDGDPAAAGMRPRWRSLDAVYRRDWANVENYAPPPAPPFGVAPRPWTELVEPADAVVARWYPTGAEAVPGR